jgi:hypothetical protein
MVILLDIKKERVAYVVEKNNWIMYQIYIPLCSGVLHLFGVLSFI